MEISTWLTDGDFHLFCKENELNGVIFFNPNSTVTFSMTPVCLPEATHMEIIVPEYCTGVTGKHIVPRLTTEMLELMNVSKKIPAVKLFRDKFGGQLTVAKCTVEQGYILECELNKVEPSAMSSQHVTYNHPAKLVEKTA